VLFIITAAAYALLCRLVLVAERVVKEYHPHLGSDAKVRLWSPFDEVKDLSAPLPVIVTHHTKRNAEKTNAEIQQPTQVPESFMCDESKSLACVQQLESSADTSQNSTETSNCTVHARRQLRQLVSRPTSSAADDSHSKCLTITSDSEVQFLLFKRLLCNGFARDHSCWFTLDEKKWQLTVKSKQEENLSVLAEQLYEYKKSGTHEIPVCLSQRLEEALYSGHWEWFCDVLRRRVNDPVVPIMTGGGGQRRLAVAAFSQKVAVGAAAKARASLLRGRVPVPNHGRKLVASAKFANRLRDISANRTVDVRTGECEITVDGLPRDVVSAVSEIDRCLHKH